MLSEFNHGEVNLRGIYYIVTLCSVAIVSACLVCLAARQLSNGWNRDCPTSDLSGEKWKSVLITVAFAWTMLTAALGFMDRRTIHAAMKFVGMFTLLPW
jgi:hypothetical protein